MARVGILGGSGLYEMEGFEGYEEVSLETPFGRPSDAVITGTLCGVPVAFVPRHGRGHLMTPSEVPYRANIYALKQLGCDRVIALSVTGSMKEEIVPGHLVLPDQLIDRTRERPSTFFGGGCVAHVGFADPFCPELRAALAVSARELDGVTLHEGGTYICIEGPHFSTRAESHLYRSWGVSVIGMTNLQEAKLAREAELCFQTVALPTDYDCWHEDEADVSVETVMQVLQQNAENAKRLLRQAIERVAATEGACGCRDALRGAIMTAPERITQAARGRLGLLIDRHLQG